jgi:hypothetical protein
MGEKIAAGTYRGRGVEGSVEHGHSKNGNEQISLLLQFGADLQNRTLTTFLNFSDNSLPYTLDRLVALGWTRGNEDPKFPGIGKNEVDVEVRYETYNGKESLKVEIFTGGGRPAMKAPMSAQEQRGFMSKLAKASKQDVAAPAAGAAAPPGEKIAL